MPRLVPEMNYGLAIERHGVTLNAVSDLAGLWYLTQFVDHWHSEIVRWPALSGVTATKRAGLIETARAG